MLDRGQISELPASPGVYIFRNRFGKVIYVGKAVNIRKRVAQYFRKNSANFADPKFRSLVKSIATVEFFKTRTENEAILLETRLIKEYAPQYNVLMRDDKRFFMIKIDLRETLPYMKLVRLKKDDGALYFGPFPHGSALRETVEFLSAKCGIKVCHYPEPTVVDYNHCIAGATGRCSAPCIGRISVENYRKKIDELILILQGNTKEIEEEIEKQMHQYAEKMDFEKAAKYRDVLANIRSLFRNDRRFQRAQIPVQSGVDSLLALKEVLNLPKPPGRIEAFDISNIAGTFATASMISFLDGRPDKKNYRRFRIKCKETPDDFAMMKEVVTRRLRRIKEEGKAPPDLILIDGGKAQLSAAISAAAELGFSDIFIVGLAKKNEEIFVPHKEESIILDPHSPALKLLQAIRDEAHRFALAYHLKLREKRIEDSLLDEIPGIGRKRKIMILKEFGSVENLRKYSAEQILSRLPKLGAKFAKKIEEFLKK